MPTSIPVTEAKARLNTLLRDSQSDDVVLMRHGRPVGVLVSYERYEDLVEGWEDAVDARAVAEFRRNPEPGGIRLEELAAQLEAERAPKASTD